MIEYICLNPKCKQIQTIDEIWDGEGYFFFCSYCQGSNFFERDAEEMEETIRIPMITVMPVNTDALEEQAKKMLARLSEENS